MYDYLAKDSQLQPYLAFPRFLLEEDLSDSAKLLYMVLFDRARLSLQHEDWQDEAGRVFVRFLIRDQAAALGKSRMSAKNALRELVSRGLVVRSRRVIGGSSRIYVKVPVQPQAAPAAGAADGARTAADGTAGGPGGERPETCPGEVKKSVPGTDRNLSGGRTENCPGEVKKTVPGTDRNLSGGWKENCPGDGQKPVRGMERKLSVCNNKKNNKEIINLRRKDAPAPLGPFRNVLLTEPELDGLRADFPDWQKRVDSLSAYLASSGRSYRSHAAAIRLWASRDPPAAAQRIYRLSEEETL